MQIKLERREIEDAVTRWVEAGVKVSEGESLLITDITVSTSGNAITCQVDTLREIEKEVTD